MSTSTEKTTEALSEADSPPVGALARRLRPLLAITMAGWTLFTIAALGFMGPGPAVLNGFGAALSASLYVALSRRPDLAPVFTHVLAGAGVLCVIGSASFSGHMLSPAVWFLVCVPVVTGYLLGIRSSVAWAVVCALAAVGVEIAGRLAPPSPHVAITGPSVLASLLVLLVIMLGFVRSATRLNSEQVEVLERREATIRSLYKGNEAQHRELIAARDAAIAASRAKSDFLATMSHEIRTPLNGVIGMAGLMLDAELPAQHRELANTIRASGDALLSVINDILDFSKIEAGRLDLEVAPFDLRQCVEDALDLFGAVAQQKGLTLTATIGEGVPIAVLGDSARVRQVLVNLLSNAVKFTAKGEITVAISARSAAEQATEREGEILDVVCSVRDTGVGVPPDRIHALFQPFTQSDASTTRKYGGTGLGLVICRRLAEAMGGSVCVESTSTSGSTFLFSFRTERARLSDPTVSPQHALTRLFPTPRLLPSVVGPAPLRVLVAEDNAVNQRVAVLLLERAGHRADVVGNGQEALEAVLARPYDLVLMDIQMPEMDGVTATRRIRAEVPTGRKPRIVALTANVRTEDRQVCRAAGMDDFLGKPIRFLELMRVLRATEKIYSPHSEVAPGREEPVSTGPQTASDPAAPRAAGVDGTALLQLRDALHSESGKFRALLEEYFVSTERLLQELEEALSRGDREIIERRAHSLKGVSGQLGASSVSHQALRIEESAASGDLDSARREASTIRALHKEACAEMLVLVGDERERASGAVAAPLAGSEPPSAAGAGAFQNTGFGPVARAREGL